MSLSAPTVVDAGAEPISCYLGEHHGAYMRCSLCFEQELQSFTQEERIHGICPSIPERDARSQWGQKCNCGKSEDETTWSHLWDLAASLVKILDLHEFPEFISEMQ